ncbi:uncharacterized protein [Cicer arietinum]|uniref:uncharacterized protein n=1 Tax=Cicer arietinum TaxID=3827 RepID=UPI003CC58DB4
MHSRIWGLCEASHSNGRPTLLLLCLYVDDMLVTGSYKEEIEEFKKYVGEILRRYIMIGCNPVVTPIDGNAKNMKHGDEDLIGYFDWCGDKSGRRSTSGYVFKLMKSSTSWSSKKKPAIALSSCEAKYIDDRYVACQALWLESLINEEFKVIMKNEFEMSDLG